MFTVNAAASLIPIAEIQGTGAPSPLAGHERSTTQGVVTASYPAGGLNGFYIQTPGADTANASDAIFVYGGVNGFTLPAAVGDSVQVSGPVAEFSGATQVEARPSRRRPVVTQTVAPAPARPARTDCLSGAALARRARSPRASCATARPATSRSATRCITNRFARARSGQGTKPLLQRPRSSLAATACLQRHEANNAARGRPRRRRVDQLPAAGRRERQPAPRLPFNGDLTPP